MYGSGVNLRGLDAGATLILIDGRRVAPSGSSGAFADISNIPLSAVQSVEILPDAAATPYGADAPGGVLNITLRDNFIGGQAHASFGAVTNGAVQEHLYDALWGKRLHFWEGGRVMLAFEYYGRDKLAADDRSQVTGNLAALGGGDFNIDYGNPGTILAGGHSWAIPHTHTGIASDYVPGTVNRYNLYKGTTILPGQKRLSGLARLHFDLSDQLDTFCDALITNRDVTANKPAITADLTVPITNPYYFNPTGGKDPVTVKYGFGDDLGPQALRGNVRTINAAGGLNWSYRDWHASAMLDYASEVENQRTSGLVNFEALAQYLVESDPAKAFDPFGVGSHTSAAILAAISAPRGFQSNSDYYGGRLDVDGALPRIPAGNVKIGAGLEYRHQTLNEVFTQTAPQLNKRQDLGRNIRSAFAQLWIPVFSPEQRIKGVERLEVSAAARLDDYSDVGQAFAPSYGIDWSPFSQISFRGTLSRTFRPPNLVDLTELNNQSLLFGLPDRSAASGVTQTLVWSGNNAQLAPESARSWTVGVTVKPSLIPASSLAFTFFDISLRSRFDQPALTLGALDDSAFQDRITRSPSQALRATVCQHSTFEGSAAACEAAPIGAIVDLRVRNLAALRTRGIDLLAQLERSIDRGTLSAEIEGTYLLEYAATQTPSLPATSLLNRQNQPINLRLRGSGYWQYRNLQLSTVVVYANHYRDWASSPPRNIASWTTVDLTASYTIVPASLSLLANTTVSLAVQNVFDRAPPFINNTTTFLGYDQENGNLLGRFLSVSLRKQW
jgi:outer membrane receptor protein involved in Fe transport